MQSKNKPSTTEMREIRQMCRKAGKARGRISRKKYYTVLNENRRYEIIKLATEKESNGL